MPVRYDEQQLRAAFRQFSRNWRWGNCSACPQDTEGNAYPEFCQFTSRYDHHLDIVDLGESYRLFARLQKEEQP